jgi:hypothetical protein
VRRHASSFGQVLRDSSSSCLREAMATCAEARIGLYQVKPVTTMSREATDIARCLRIGVLSPVYLCRRCRYVGMNGSERDVLKAQRHRSSYKRRC